MLRNNRVIWFLSNKDIQNAREGGPPERPAPQTHMEMGGL